jgi:hypothetical protein
MRNRVDMDEKTSRAIIREIGERLQAVIRQMIRTYRRASENRSIDSASRKANHRRYFPPWSMGSSTSHANT